MRSIAKPGTDFGRPARRAAVRPMVRPWSPIWVVAAIATSSTRAGGRFGLRDINSRMHRMTRSSARVFAYMLPALPNGTRTPSTNTTSRTERALMSLLEARCRARLCYSPVTRRIDRVHMWSEPQLDVPWRRLRPSRGQVDRRHAHLLPAAGQVAGDALAERSLLGRLQGRRHDLTQRGYQGIGRHCQQ